MKAKKNPEPAPKSRRLEIAKQPGKSDDRLLTDLIAEGEAINASLALRYVYTEHGEGSLTDMVASLREHGQAVNRGDLTAAERMLNAQAVALNAIFCELARRSALNMGEYIDATERYMRLALKAQGQCRATFETLAAIKNPPVVFAKQANINNGGQQQVNNGQSAVSGAIRPDARAPAGKAAFEPNELLETSGGQGMDTRAAGATGRTDSDLAAVDAVDRPA